PAEHGFAGTPDFGEFGGQPKKSARPDLRRQHAGSGPEHEKSQARGKDFLKELPHLPAVEKPYVHRVPACRVSGVAPTLVTACRRTPRRSRPVASQLMDRPIGLPTAPRSF